MTTPVHVSFDLLLAYLLYKFGLVEVQAADIVLILSANLVDLDHLLARPIYHPRRNPFITHPLHKLWYLLLLFAVGLLFIRKAAFLGVGILSHLLLDFLDVKWHKL